MKVLCLYDYPPSPGGLATQGDLLYQGLREMGVEVYAADTESNQEKEWYYHWFKPDIVVGVGYWGHAPHLILHPQKHAMQPVPWLVADGYIANYNKELNALPLILVTSHWVKEMYVRDGIKPDNIEILPVGCQTDQFTPRSMDDPKIRAVRDWLGISPEQLMILTIGGDAASKGAQEVMQALASIKQHVPDWRYVCKVWPQERTDQQNLLDLKLAKELGIAHKIICAKNTISRNFMPYLMAACDIYAAPSRLEGFGMPHVEAGASGKPVIGINAMGLLDTMIHGETALLAGVDRKIVIDEVILGEESGYPKNHKIVFDEPRTVDYRASVPDIAEHLRTLMNDPPLRQKMGAAGRIRAAEHFDYRVVAKRFVEIIQHRLGID